MSCKDCKWESVEEDDFWVWDVSPEDPVRTISLCHYEPKRQVVAADWWCRHYAQKATEDE